MPSCRARRRRDGLSAGGRSRERRSAVVRTHVNAAGAAAVIPLLDGPVRDGAVVGAFSRAVIISVGTPEGPRVLSLLAPRAAGMPNGVRLSADDSVALTRPVPGEAVSVGTGRI